MIESFRNLFKDEVPAVGEELRILEEIVRRQPLPRLA
jgi:GMP synthase PP-ATPase subunit